MISSLFILDQRGQVLIARHFRPYQFALPPSPGYPATSISDAELFRINVIAPQSCLPMHILAPKTCSLHIQHASMYIVAIIREHDCNAAIIFEWLSRLVHVLQSYFGGKFTVDACKAYFVKIHQVLEEMVDFGFIQTTDMQVLKSKVETLEKTSDPFKLKTVILFSPFFSSSFSSSSFCYKYDVF